MAKGRLVWQVLLGVGVTVVILALSIAWTLDSAARDDLVGQAARRLETRLDQVTAALTESAGAAEVAEVVRLAGVLGAGSVELLPAGEGPREGARGGEVDGVAWLYGVREVQSLGILEVGIPVVSADAEPLDVVARVLRASALAGGFCLLFGAFFALRTTRRIRAVSDFVDQIGASDAESNGQRMSSPGSGEVGDLVRSVNRMAADLERRNRGMQREMFQKSAILASMADGVLAVDAALRVVLINDTAKEMLPFVKASPEGEPLADVLPQAELLALVRTCVEDQKHGRKRAVSIERLGSPKRIVELRASPLLKSPDGGCVLLIQDRTEIERLERVRRDFVANVSHELKTPLTSVRGYLETVRDDPDLSPAMRTKFLDKSIRNADRLAAIIGDLLTLARAEGGAGVAKGERIELESLARSVITELHPLAVAGGITLKLEAASSVATQGDRVALTSALLNLVENAIKYSPRDTTVRLQITKTKNKARVLVEDQGAGIPEEQLDRVFERFYRVDVERSRELGGTGLGLSIVRHVALTHGGQVRVESSLGTGSRFTLELPVLSAS